LDEGANIEVPFFVIYLIKIKYLREFVKNEEYLNKKLPSTILVNHSFPYLSKYCAQVRKQLFFEFSASQQINIRSP